MIAQRLELLHHFERAGRLLLGRKAFYKKVFEEILIRQFGLKISPLHFNFAKTLLRKKGRKQQNSNKQLSRIL